MSDMAPSVAVAGGPSVQRRRVLLSAFACSPQWGSEPGVGWQWLMQLVRLHDVVLVTHSYFRAHLEPALQAAAIERLQVVYVEAPHFGLHPHRQLNSRLFYIWWQVWVRREVARMVRQAHFDVIHHLTWGTLRFPCFLGGLGVPLVMGPLGGGEVAPLRLYDGLPFKARAFDYMRSLTLLWVRLDPLATLGPRRSALVLCKSKESLQALPASVRQRAVVVPEIGSPPIEARTRDATVAGGADAPQRRFKLLFAGRLLGWKGVALALGAVSKLVQAGRNVEFDIAGDGPLRPFLFRRLQELQLQDRVKLRGAIPREELLALYGCADLFVFPSLHDSSGNVVLESLSRGLPVVCLDLGGPHTYIDSHCGVVVSTCDRSVPAVEQALADAIGGVLDDPERLARMQAAAIVHAGCQTWASVVNRAYAAIGGRLGWGQP